MVSVGLLLCAEISMGLMMIFRSGGEEQSLAISLTRLDESVIIGLLDRVDISFQYVLAK